MVNEAGEAAGRGRVALEGGNNSLAVPPPRSTPSGDEDRGLIEDVDVMPLIDFCIDEVRPMIDSKQLSVNVRVTTCSWCARTRSACARSS